jgi:metal-dependent amidase/aminoacylase/carboxypeptidase family protein
MPEAEEQSLDAQRFLRLFKAQFPELSYPESETNERIHAFAKENGVTRAVARMAILKKYGRDIGE